MLPLCQPVEGTEFVVVWAYCRVPPEPLLERFTVAVTFAAAALSFVTEEITGAVYEEPELIVPDTVPLLFVPPLPPYIKKNTE